MKEKFNVRLSQPPHQKDGPLTKDEVQCPVCWSILMQPVTLPCDHSLCLVCYHNTMKEGCLSCPCCRMRISVWSRRAVKTDNLVNLAFWNKIKEQFPQFVTARELGKDSQDVLEELNCDSTEDEGSLNLSVTGDVDSNISRLDGTIITSPGKIAADFKVLYKQHEEDLQAKKILEAKANVELIRKFKADDGFATQQIDLEASEDESSDVINSLSNAYQSFPAIPQVSNQKVSECSQNSLCRNLFSEWGTDSDSQENGALRKPSKVSIGCKRNATHLTPRAVRKRITWPDTLTDATSFPQRKKQVIVPIDKNVASSSSKVVNCVPNTCAPPQPVTSQCVSVHVKASSSFVPVYSPRMEVSESTKVTLNGNRRLSLDSRPAETKTKLDYIKRSHVHTSSDTPDSINIEVNSHFRPIRSAPKTPPKQLPDGSYLPEPRLVKSTPIRLGSASAAIMLTSLSQQIAKIERNSKANKASSQSSGENGSRFYTSSSTISDSARTAEILSPQPPALVHYSTQMPFSPNSSEDTTEEGRTTEPPPELDLYNGEDDVRERERQVSEMRYRQVQAIQLEQFRQKKLQEEKDRAYAEKLQRELNTSAVTVARTRGSSERYSIRNWVNSGPQLMESEQVPSTIIPVKNYTIRTTRTKQKVSKAIPVTRFSSNKTANTSLPKRTRTRKSCSTTAIVLANSRVTRSQSLRYGPALQN